MGNPNILVVINQYSFPLRSTVRDSIFCFEKYSDNVIYYLNTARLKTIPAHIYKIKFDLIIFHTSFMSFRWGQDVEYKRLYNLLDYFKSLNCIKVATPQDEWIHTDLLNKFINDFNINQVFSVAAETEWPIIYNNVDFLKVDFNRILTGYIDPSVVNRFSNSDIHERKIDIGYRAYKAPPWLGKHGYMKTLIANIFDVKAKETHIIADISVDEKDTFVGDQWYEFLRKCKYFIGVEGGSTVLDRDGKIWEKGVKYVSENPLASYEEVEKAVFQNKEGTLNLVAISPRHLECCITRTCQILIKGEYNGILVPRKHFIELNEDFSNIDEVLNIVKNDESREQIVNNAFNDIVASKKYSYPHFVDFILSKALPEVSESKMNHNSFITENKFHYNRQLLINTFYCIAYKYYSSIKKRVNFIFKFK